MAFNRLLTGFKVAAATARNLLMSLNSLMVKTHLQHLKKATHSLYQCCTLQQYHNSVSAKVCQPVKVFGLDVTQNEECPYKHFCLKPTL